MKKEREIVGEEKVVEGGSGKFVVTLTKADHMRNALMLRAGSHLPATLDYNTWLKYGRFLGEVEDWVAFRIGDWINARITDQEVGDEKKYALAEELTHKSYQTLANYASVAKRLPPSRRREVKPLTWAHHEAVAALPVEQQKEFLEQALEHRWPIVKLRTEIKKWRELAEGAIDVTHGRVPEKVRRSIRQASAGYMVEAERPVKTSMRMVLKEAVLVAKDFANKAEAALREPREFGREVAEVALDLKELLTQFERNLADAGVLNIEDDVEETEKT